MVLNSWITAAPSAWYTSGTCGQYLSFHICQYQLPRHNKWWPHFIEIPLQWTNIMKNNRCSHLPSKELPVQYVFTKDYALILCARTHTHTHLMKKYPKNYKRRAERLQVSSSTYLPDHYKCFWHNGLSFMYWEANVTSTTYVFKYCHNLHFTTQFVKNKQNHTNKAGTSRCTQ